MSLPNVSASFINIFMWIYNVGTRGVDPNEVGYGRSELQFFFIFIYRFNCQ